MKKDNILIQVLESSINKMKSPYKKIGIGFIKEKIIKHTNNKRIKTVKINGDVFSYQNDLAFRHSIEEIYFSEIYKFNTTSEKPHIIDCGANIGLSIFYFKQHYKNSKILAFEPDLINYKLLEKNISTIQCDDDITIYNSAIWKEDGEIKFDSCGDLGGKISQDQSVLTTSNKVKTVRLKNLLSEKVDLLKIDLEGAEYEVINDCKDDLGMISNIFIEYHGDFKENEKLSKILEIIHKAGFKYYIKEAANVYPTPFDRGKNKHNFDIQLNIFAFRD